MGHSKKNKIFDCLILKKKEMFPLNIQLQSIEFIDKIVQDCDSIRVSVTTFPDEQKLNTSFEVKQIRTAFPSFTVNVSDRTEKILIVFRKKYLVQRDPIIASTVITSDDLPKLINGSFDQEKEFDLLEPRKKATNKENFFGEPNRKILGKVDVKMSIADERQIPEYAAIRKISKIHSGQEFPKTKIYQ